MDAMPRRTVVRTAAWSAPVVVVSAVAPAYAASAGTLVASYGSTALLSSNGYWYVNAASLSVTSSAAIAANDLKLTSTYSNTAVTQNANSARAPWVLTTGNPSNPAVWSYPSVVAAGATITFPNGLFLAVPRTANGTYTLRFSNGATTSLPLVLTTTSAAAPRGAQRQTDPFA